MEAWPSNKRVGPGVPKGGEELGKVKSVGERLKRSVPLEPPCFEDGRCRILRFSDSLFVFFWWEN